VSKERQTERDQEREPVTTVARCFIPTENSCTIQSSLRPWESQWRLVRSDFRWWRSQAL